MFLKTAAFFTMFMLLFMGCSRQDKTSCFTVDNVYGEATLVRSGESKSLTTQTILNLNDVVVTGDRAVVKLSQPDGNIFFIGNNTSVNVGYTEKTDEKCYQSSLTLNNGSAYLIKSGNDSVICKIHSASGTVSVSSGDVLVSFDQELKKLSVSALNDSAKIMAGPSVFLLPSCTHMNVVDNMAGQLEPIAESVLHEIRQWVPTELVDAGLDKSGCTAIAPVIHNLPPEWVRLPHEICAAGREFTDTVRAADPEQGPVSYRLKNAPSGMSIGASTGIIQYSPRAAGKFKVTITAEDADSLNVNIDYELDVIEGLGVVLTVPGIVSVNQTVRISATPVKSRNAKPPFRYRFDLDGDGTFDFPADGKFGDKFETDKQFRKGGDYRVKVEIKDASGSLASSEALISVKSHPHASLKITPEKALAGSDFLLDASGSYDDHVSSESLAVRFDINGDGKWDIPSDKGFLREKKVVWSWPDPGRYNVVIEVVNKYSLSDTSTVSVTVASNLGIDSISAFDSVHTQDTVQFECFYSPADVKIKKIEWSMDGDTLFEVESASGIFRHVFKKSGQYVILCRITDDNEQNLIAQKRLTVLNASAEISAGGNYDVRINEVVTLRGVAKDKDSKIVSFSWDFDGDGKIDTSSGSSASVSHRFTRSGRKVVYFIVTTDDGAKWKDSAVVNVVNKKPHAAAGDDITGKEGRAVKLNGIGRDEDNNIVRYEWDFDSDGKYDWTSDKNGNVSHRFDKYSNAIFKVTDSDGDSAVDTIRVVICPDEMILVKERKMCVDKYEYPGKAGSLPAVNVTYEEALRICADQGKHLCSAQEWTASCRQSPRESYPYGRQYEKDRCNTLGNVYVKNKLAPSGEFPKCAGETGITDMSGNAAEWVSGNDNPETYVYGGSYQNGKDDVKCDSKVQLQKGRKYFYAGFRCCK